MLHLWLIAPRLIPDRETQYRGSSPRVFNAVLHVGEDSAANQRTLADNCNMLVYGAGGYTFGDYTRVGAPLLLLMTGVFAVILPAFCPAS